ncbi:MAG: ATP-binding protein [Spirochaetia bacterium]
MIPRKLAPVLQRAAGKFPVVTVLGPRQSGKTTLVRALFPDHTYINLENPQTRTLFREDPKSLLREGREALIVDEAQREPEILSWVQVFVDRENAAGQFVLTGSDQPALGEAISQSLAGRTSIHHLLPLSLEELEAENLVSHRDETLVKGFLPRLYDAGMSPADIYSSYFATYVERDVRRLINVKDMTKFETFIRLLAGRVGQLVNLSSLAGDVGASSTTLGGWLSALEASFVVIRLPPYHANLGKRLVKTPKLYFAEPGLLAWLLQIETPEQVSRDPLLGSVFENMIVVEAVKAAYNRGASPQLSFYRDKTGLEIDLIREYQRRPFAVEIKAGATYVPDMTTALVRFRSLHEGLAGASLVYGGTESTTVNGIRVVPFPRTAQLLFGESEAAAPSS